MLNVIGLYSEELRARLERSAEQRGATGSRTPQGMNLNENGKGEVEVYWRHPFKVKRALLADIDELNEKIEHLNHIALEEVNF